MQRTARFATLALQVASLFLGCGQSFAQGLPAQALASERGAASTENDVGDEAYKGLIENPQSEAQLVRAVQNPVPRIVIVHLQGNNSFSLSPYKLTQDVLNVQPIIPLPLGENWNLVVRMMQPIVWQPSTGKNGRSTYGFGDMNPTFYLAPARPGRLIWGVGPAFLLPTATRYTLGQGKLSVGPSALLLTQPGPWTLGVQVNNVWSVAGPVSRPAVNQMTFQYFANRNLSRGWYIAVSPTITANWRARAGSVWTVPFGAGIGRVTRLGFQPINLKAQCFGNVVYPSGSPSWKVQMQVSFLFPKLSLQSPAH